MFQYRFTSMTSVATLALAALGLAPVLPAQAQTTIASDYSGNYTTSTGPNADPTVVNGGTGFAGPFSVFQGPRSSFYFYDSRLNGSGADNGGNTPSGVGINDANNRAFGLNHSGGDETVQRTLSTPIAVGDTFSFALDNGYVDNGYQRMFLGTATNFYPVEFGFKGQGGGGYQFNGDYSATTAANFGFTDGGLTVSFTLNTPTTYTMTAMQLNDTNKTVTYNGTLPSALNLDTITFQTTDPGTNQYHDFYFNNLSVVAPAPEPSQSAALMVGMLGLGGLCLARRRQNPRPV